MCKKVMFLMVVVLLAVAAQQVQANQAWWNGGTGLWSDDANWDTGVPSGGPLAAVNAPGSYAIIDYAAPNPGVVFVGEAGGPRTATVEVATGGSILANQLYAGNGGATGIWQITGGTAESINAIGLGRNGGTETGIINLESGKVICDTWMTVLGNSVINLDGGTLTFNGSFNWSPTARLVFNGGTLVGKAQTQAQLQSLLTSFGANIALGAGYTGLAYGTTNEGYGKAWAVVPEPATMVLLGLGGLLLRRRK